MRLPASVLLCLVVPILALAQEPGGRSDPELGRYEGSVFNQKADGTRGAQSTLFIIFRREGQNLACTGSTSSFDSQLPCTEVSEEQSHFRFTLPFGGGVIFDLNASNGSMTGSMSPKPGVRKPPFDKVELRRMGDATLSDLIPPLEWEGTDRSTAILQLRKKSSEGNAGAVAEFWATVKAAGGPIVESVSEQSALVTFSWQGEAQTKNVLLMWPRLTNARPDNYFFSHIPNTDVWFKTLKVRAGTRMYYQISPDDPSGQRPQGSWPRKAQADPFNPKRDRTDPLLPLTSVRSLLEMPDAPPQPWYVKNLDVPKYTAVEEKLTSRNVTGERRILVYLPPGYSPAHARYPSIYLTDGEDPDGLVFATWTFENLIAAKKIPPMVIVRIVNLNQATRSVELDCDASFATYLNSELVPLIRKKFNTSVDPRKTAIGGYSLGGLAASCEAFRHSETFGLVLSQSGSYWYEPTQKDFAEPNWLARQFASTKKPPIRFYMEAGTNELDINMDGSGILVPNRQLRDVLIAKGYDVCYHEFEGDHEYINWRGTLADGLIALFGVAQCQPNAR